VNGRGMCVEDGRMCVNAGCFCVDDVDMCVDGWGTCVGPFTPIFIHPYSPLLCDDGGIAGDMCTDVGGGV
jgi:hypothetical protein